MLIQNIKTDEVETGSTSGSKGPECSKRRVQTEYKRKYRFENSRKVFFSSKKSNAKRVGLDFNLSMEDLNFPDKCPIFGFDLDYSRKGIKGPSDKGPTVDRINPNFGYVKGNVRIISGKANRLKSNMTVEECELILKDLKQLEKNNVLDASKKEEIIPGIT